MLRHGMMVLCVLALVFAGAGIASAVTYTFYDLTVTGDSTSFAYGINSSNVVTGRWQNGGTSGAYVWSPTVARTSLPPLNGTGTVGVGLGINDSAVVTGLSSSTTPSGNQGFRYNTNGTLANLGDDTNDNVGARFATAPTTSRGTGINSTGQVTGYGTVSGATNAYFWDGNTSHNVNLLLPSGAGGYNYGLGVNDSGLVVGYYGNSTGPVVNTPLVWQGGTFTNILPSMQTQLPGTVWAGALGVNNTGEIVGTYSTGTNFQTGTLQIGSAYLYKDSTHIVDLGNIGTGFHAQANGINNNGTVVGTAVLGDNSTQHAFVWAPTVANGTTSTTGMVDLNSLGIGGLPSGYYFQSALGINNDGSIVGNMFNGTTYRAFALVAPHVVTPEPATLLLAATGLIGLIAYAWRKRR
jgi:probable HAF family extracellular repeat protein